MVDTAGQPMSRRTITTSQTVAEVLARRIDGKPADDFVFTTTERSALHNGDFYTHVWRKLSKALRVRASRPSGSTICGQPHSRVPRGCP